MQTLFRIRPETDQVTNLGPLVWPGDIAVGSVALCSALTEQYRETIPPPSLAKVAILGNTPPE